MARDTAVITWGPREHPPPASLPWRRRARSSSVSAAARAAGLDPVLEMHALALKGGRRPRSSDSVTRRIFLQPNGVLTDGVTATGNFALGSAAHAYLQFDLSSRRNGLGSGTSVARMREPRTRSAASTGRGLPREPGACRRAATRHRPRWSASTPPSRASPPKTCRPGGSTLASGCGAARTTSCSIPRGRSWPSSWSRPTLANISSGWQYHHDRDLTGFEDGSENPSIVEATSVALVPPGSARARRSCFCSNGRTTLISWEALPVTSQEAIIGRRKSDSEELDPKPPTSHVARTDRIASARSSAGTSPTGRCRTTGRSSSGSVAANHPLRQMLEAWSVGDPSRPTSSRASPASSPAAHDVIPSADRLAAFGEEDRA